MRTLLHLTVCWLLSLCPVVGQGQGEAQRVSEPPGAQVHAEEEEEEEERPLGSSSAYMAAIPGQRPQRIAPGGTGALVVVLALRQRAIIEADELFSVTYSERQGALTLGPWRRRPPGVGKHHDGSRGRPVYDDTIVVEVPLSVDAAASPGDHRAIVRVSARIHDGEEGRLLGQTTLDVVCPITIGAPVSAAPRRGDRSSAASPSGGPGEQGFALSLPSLVRLPTGSQHTFEVGLEIPAGFYISRDSDLDAPKLVLGEVGDGLRVFTGDHPPSLDGGARGEIYRGEYMRSVTLVVEPGARIGERQIPISLRFLPCDADVCYPPASLGGRLEVEVTDGGEVAVIPAPSRREGDGAAQSVATAESTPDLWPYFLLGAAAAVVVLLVMQRFWSSAR